MDRLAGFLERRRWVVLGAWILLLVAALSFAAKQTDHLTMEIMGRWNWWLPKRVDRVLPHAGFESGSGRREPALDLGR
jgi:uncharacterized membrane protein YdfJ with MMPL/SSD domain